MTDKESEQLITEFDGRYYNLSTFAELHPAGPDVLRHANGKSIDAYMRGGASIDGQRHKHSAAAYKILNKFECSKNGVLLKQDDDSMVDYANMDFSKAMLPQVGQLGDKYWDWIHDPVELRMRLFPSDFLEKFTRTKWYIVLLLWMPAVLYFARQGVIAISEKMPVHQAYVVGALLFLCGVLSWTFFEYVLHRCVYHWAPNPKSPAQLTLHFLLHGIHHKTPMDPDRLVAPPTLSGTFVAIFYTAFRLTLPWHYGAVFGSGTLFGYICYDLTHYYLHHGRPKLNSYSHQLKRYHHAHHYEHHDAGYGVSSPIWDYVFSTKPNSKKSQ